MSGGAAGVRCSPLALVVAVLLTVAIACGREPRAERTAGVDTHLPSAAPLGSGVSPTMTPERPLALRREAQRLLDSARTALGAGDTRSATALLHRAAAFLLIEANAPPTSAHADLLASADSLDAWAGRLARGLSTDSSALRRLSALLNLTEAERHGSLAEVAWSTGNKESISDELTMAADHVDRAAVDAHLVLSPRMLRTIAEMRRMAMRLATEPGLDVKSLEEPTAELQLEIEAMRRELARGARSRAMP